MSKLLFEAVKTKNLAGIKEILSSGASPNVVDVDGTPLLHMCIKFGDQPLLEYILSQYNTNLNITDPSGNTGLHAAASTNNLEFIKTLLNSGINPKKKNQSGQVALDLTSDVACKTTLAALDVSEKAKDSVTMEIEMGLPDDINELSSLSAQVVFETKIFLERCKKSLSQLTKEEKAANHKLGLLKKSIKPETEINAQIQHMQQESEEREATIASLKKQNYILKNCSTVTEKYYETFISELNENFAQDEKILKDRINESEKKIQEYQNYAETECRQIMAENKELSKDVVEKKVGLLPNESLPVVHQENLLLQQKFRELQNEKHILAVRFSSSEKLKNLFDNRNSKVRSDEQLLKKQMQESVAKVSNNSAMDNDDYYEVSAQIIYERGENGVKHIKAATVDKLFERLTDAQVDDNEFQEPFLITFKLFIDYDEFFRQMDKRFKENSATNSKVREKIIQVVKHLIEMNWNDFQEDKNLLGKTTDFIEAVNRVNKNLGSIVLTVLKEKSSADTASSTEELKKNNSLPKPKPVVPKALIKKYENVQTSSVRDDKLLMKNWIGFNPGKLKSANDTIKFKFSELDPIELARQITLMDYELFQALKPTELVDQSWSKSGHISSPPSANNMKKWNQHVTRWIVSEVVTSRDGTKNRAHVIERCISLAEHLEKLKNFNAVKNIVTAFQTSALFRLKKSKEAVSPKLMKVLDDLTKLTSDSTVKNFKARVTQHEPPLIPILSDYENQLLVLDSSARTKLDNGLINFAKFQKISGCLLELQTYQQMPYSFEIVMEIQEYVKSYQSLSDDEAYHESLICEPREN